MSSATESVALASRINLTGKVALVTGGSRGIGAAIVRELAGLGAEVFFTYSASAGPAQAIAAELKAAGKKVHAIKADVASPAEIKQLFATLDSLATQKTTAGSAALDILVNNAGVYLTAPISEFKDSDYEKTVAVNINGVYYTTRHAVGRLRDKGRIITIGSVVGETSLSPGHSVYAASKFAVQGLSRGFARDLASRGITSNTVQPGPINTDMNPDDMEKNPWAAAVRQMVPMGRYGQAVEVANLVGFLASPAADFITGSNINIDGGIGA